MADPLDRTNKAPRLLTALTIIGVLMIAFASLSFNFDNSSAADAEDSIPISSPEDLARVGSGDDFSGHIWSLDAYYYLTNDIVLVGENNHTAIGTAEDPFTGTFDGNGHVISGININTDRTTGLIAYLSGGMVKDLGMVDGSITMLTDVTENTSAGIVGVASTATISNCYNTCDITVQNTSGNFVAVCAGGIAGTSHGGTVISNCYNTGAITGLDSYFARPAGIAGAGDNTTIINCYNTGVISSTGHNPHAAGIMAEGPALTITNCYNTGSITSNALTDIARAGGITAWASADLVVTNCYNTGSISSLGGAIASGGILGGGYGSIINCYYLTGQLYENGALVADNLFGQADVVVDGSGDPPRLSIQGSSEAKQAYQMKAWLPDAIAGISIYYTGTTAYNGQSVPGWDFADIWTINEDINDGYPILRSSLPAFETPTASVNAISGMHIYYVPTLTDGATVTVSGLPEGLSWDGKALTGSVSSAGSYAITLVASWDYQGATVTDTQKIEVTVDSAPSFSSSYVEIETLDGHELIYTPVLTDGATITADITVEGITWDGTSLIISTSETGELTIRLNAVWIVYGTEITDEQIIHIIVSEPPSFSVDTVLIETSAGKEIGYTPVLDDGASVTASDLPDGLVWNGTMLSGKIATAGEYTVTLTATWNIDGTDHNDEQKISIIVTSAGGGGGGEDGKDDDGKGVLDDIKGFLGSDIHMLYYLLIVICVIALAVSAYLRRPVLSVMALSALIILVLNEYMGWF